MTWNITSDQLIATFAGSYFLGLTLRMVIRATQRLIGAWWL